MDISALGSKANFLRLETLTLHTLLFFFHLTSHIFSIFFARLILGPFFFSIDISSEVTSTSSMTLNASVCSQIHTSSPDQDTQFDVATWMPGKYEEQVIYHPNPSKCKSRCYELSWNHRHNSNCPRQTGTYSHTVLVWHSSHNMFKMEISNQP